MARVPVRKTERGRGELARLHDDMDDLIRSFFFEDWGMPLWRGGHWPTIDVGETESQFVIKAEVPGCKAEDIDISVSGNTLTISGEKKEEEERKKKGYYHVERSYGSFRRDITLGSEVDPAKIEAECKDGVLSITLAKSEKARPTKIKVKGQ